MSEHGENVNTIAMYLRETSERAGADGRAETSKRLFGYSNQLLRAAEYIVSLEGLTSALPPELGNIHDLPEDLLGELNVAKTDELEDQIVTVINAYGDEANLDQILVGLYRKFKVIQKRRFLQNKLYRMQMVWSVEGRKGVYTTSKPQEKPGSHPAAGGPFDIDTGEPEEIPF